MSVTLQRCRVSILVKALPQLSAAHGETVCCAGLEETAAPGDDEVAGDI